MSGNLSSKYEVAIGDIHGCYDQLERLVDSVQEWMNGAEWMAIPLGDYVDRGPASRQVVEWLIDAQNPSLKPLRGNHEQMMIDAYRGRNLSSVDLWLANGGHQTMESYGVMNLPRWVREASFMDEIPVDHIEFLESLPVTVETEHRIYVHAGLDPRRPQERDPQTLMWIRDAFLRSGYEWPKHVVHGHTPREQPELKANRTNIDTGCFHYGVLTAAIFDNEVKGGPIHVIQSR